MIIPQELIQEAKKRLGNDTAIRIAEDLQFKQFDNRNLKALCYWHEEDTPSLVWNQKDCYYHCFGCGRKYDIIDHYMETKKLTFLEAIEKLFQETDIDFKFGERNVKTKREYRYPYLENGDMAKIINYLTKRKISEETINYCDVKADDKGNIVFNYYDTNDVLTMVKYRPAKKLKKGETKSWCQKDADATPLLFNMNRTNPSQPLLICEGEIDSLAAIEAGYKNAVSVPFGANNYTWIEENWDFLEQFNKIIIWADNDECGAKMKQNVIPRLGQWRCYEVDPPTTFEKENGEIAKVNDINEVLYYYGKEKVLEVINNAKEIPISNIIDLSAVQDFDLRHSEGVYSGLKEFDKWIYKFFFGCVNVITGINSCVDSETEYFNGTQWKKISEYQEGEKVLQYNMNGTAELVYPIDYIKEPCNEFYLVKNRSGIEQCVTRNHNMIYLTSKGHINKISFEEIKRRNDEIKNGFYGKFITTFRTKENKRIPLNEYELRLAVAICADGHFPKWNKKICRMNLKKERLRWLLEKCNIPIDERFYNGTAKGYSNFYFVPPMKFRVFPKEWFNAPEDQMRIILDEIMYWDGSKNHNAYFTTIKENADFIQYIASACGYRAVIHEDIRKTCYGVYITKQIHPTILHLGLVHLKQERIKRYYNHDGHKYCFTVPSGMLVLRRNGMINITGNSGKSVLVNQMCIAEPLNQGYDVFVFSGELTKPQLKSWLEWNFAGRRHITLVDNHVKKINPEKLKQIREWYKDRIYVYDNDTDHTATSILSKMEELARRKGVKVFVIDNLMMVDLECGFDSLWQKQKEFMIKLVNFANKFNALVHLVAHPRKVETMRRLTKLDISGSGDITNLAHYVMGIHRYTPKEKAGEKRSDGKYKVEPIEHDCVIDLFKNRITGTQDKELKLYFDKVSYRFWTDLEGLDKQYKWDKGAYKDKLPDPRDMPDIFK